MQIRLRSRTACAAIVIDPFIAHSGVFGQAQLEPETAFDSDQTGAAIREGLPQGCGASAGGDLARPQQKIRASQAGSSSTFNTTNAPIRKDQ